MSELENENPYPKMGEVKHHLVKPTTMKETEIAEKKLEVYWRNKFQDKLDEFTALKKNNKELRETLLKKLMVNLNNTNELSTDMLYKLTDVFEMDAIEIFKEIKHLNNKQ